MVGVEEGREFRKDLYSQESTFPLVFLCICVLVLYLLVVRAASIDGCLCHSGSLPLLSCMLVLIVF